jgi:hypothetical protein
MQALFIIALQVAVIVIFRWGYNYRVRLWNWTSFYYTYGYGKEFSGKRYDCHIHFADLKSGTRCFAGADKYGLYLFAYPSPYRSWYLQPLWTKSIRIDLRIPWNQLAWRPGLGGVRE